MSVYHLKVCLSTSGFDVLLPDVVGLGKFFDNGNRINGSSGKVE